jgi:hypothetical protein
MFKKILMGTVLALAVVVVMGSPVISSLVHSAHAQVSTTWSVASTTALGQNAETQAAGNAYNMIWLITAITLGLAAFFFALRWLWNRIAGRH